MTWGAPIWIYLWAAGMAGGAYFTGFLVDRFSGGRNKNLFQLSVYLGIPLVILGVLLLIIDLGSPIEFWHLFTQFKVSSPMSLGTWILISWAIFAVLQVIIWFIQGDILKNVKLYPAGMEGRMNAIAGVLGWVGFLLSMAVMSYTGVLLAVSAQSIWADTFLLPALFTASAISTGVALLVLVAFIVNARSSGEAFASKIIERLAEADAIVILVESAVLIGYAIWLSASGSAGGEALSLLTTGELAVMFWVGFILLALLLPLALDLLNWGKKVEEKSVMFAISLSAVSVLVGGFILRVVITMGGQL